VRILQYVIRPALHCLGDIDDCSVYRITVVGDYRISFRYSVVIMGVISLGFSLMRVQAPKRI
jgi:hypothetical protein